MRVFVILLAAHGNVTAQLQFNRVLSVTPMATTQENFRGNVCSESPGGIKGA